jgi:crossover junction endodeoxyribonuclease RuvC
MTLVLGIDPGTATTGFGLVSDRVDGGLESAGFGTIQTPSGMAAHKRLSLLYKQLNEILLLHKPDSCAVERLFFKRNISTAISVGQARGVMMLAISEAGLEMAEYTPNEVKQAVAGYGSAGKKQVQEMVRVLLGLPEIPKPDDAADALAIAITHLNTQNYGVILDCNIAR